MRFYTKNQEHELEATLQRIKAVDPRAPIRIAEIIGFPFADFTEMQREIRAGNFIIAKFAFLQEPVTLKLVNPKSWLLYSTSVAATYLIPIISILLAFTVSHWFWLGLIYFIIGTRFTVGIWTSSIIQAAFHSELAFCLLFYSSKINTYDLRSSREYEWQLLKQETQGS